MADSSSKTEPVLKESTVQVTNIKQHRFSKIRNLFFATLVVSGQVGQNIVLPLWIDSGKKKHHPNTSSIVTNKSKANNSNSADEYQPFMDQYFVAVFTGFGYMVLFGAAFAVKCYLYKFKFQDIVSYRRLISHKKIILNGVLFGMSSFFIVYAASGTRTAPYLQAILMNINIPTTLAIRFFFLRKVPSIRKFICAITTVLSLLVCLLPSIFPKIDPKHKEDGKEQGGASGLAGVLWPFCFMLGFVFMSISCIIQENVVKYQHSSSKQKVDLSYIICLTQVSQFFFLLLLFWADAIPGFGNVDSISKVLSNCWYGMRCLFGGNGCSTSAYSGLFAFLYIFLFACYITGAVNLLRYCEGATFLAIVQAMVTPLGFLFWTLFKEQPSFHWHPEVSITVWLNIAGLVIMVPSIYFYNTGEPEKSMEKTKMTKIPSEESPLLAD